MPKDFAPQNHIQFDLFASLASKPGSSPVAAPDVAASPVESAPVAGPATSQEGGMTFSGLLLQSRARLAARRAMAANIAAPGQAVAFVHQNGQRALIGADMSKPGGYRLTRFDADGPVGHVEYPTMEAAAFDAMQGGFEVEQPLAEGAAVAAAASPAIPEAAILKPAASESDSDAAWHGLNEAAAGAVASRFGLEAQEARELLTLSLDVLRGRDRVLPPSNGETPEPPLGLPLGSAKAAAFNTDPGQSYVEVLRQFDPAALVTTEPESDIRRHPTFDRYVAWWRAGHHAPPLTVVRDPARGTLLTTSRRRALTAVEAGVPAVQGWFSPNNQDTGLPLKYGDVLAAYREALSPHHAASKEAMATPDPTVPAGGETVSDSRGTPVSATGLAMASDDYLAPLSDWGVPFGNKGQRRALNYKATAVLERLAKDGRGSATEEDRAVLARYTGTGGIGDSLNEYYTQPDLAETIWSLLRQAGFSGGDVIEPSCGTGVFLRTAPADARVTGVEMNPVSASIAQIVHGPTRHDVLHSSLEGFATTDPRLFDAVIGNAPFGLRGKTLGDDKRHLSVAECYMLDTGLDKLRNGGVLAMILPTGVLDSQANKAFRHGLLCKAQPIAAFRLPNTAFAASHTEVTTDIVLLRKRPIDIAGALGALSLEQLAALGMWDEEFVNGDYFAGRGAANVLGAMAEGWRAHAGMGQDITVHGSMDMVLARLKAWRPTAQELADNSPTLPDILRALTSDHARAAATRGALKRPYQEALPGDARVIGGTRYVLRQFEGERPEWREEPEAMPQAVLDAGPVAELLKAVSQGSDEDRADLIASLDRYVAAHGIPARNPALRRWIDAPTMPVREGRSRMDHAAEVAERQRLIARLLGAVREDGSYSDLVTGRVHEAAPLSFEEALTALTIEGDGFTARQLAQAAGQEPSAVEARLFKSPEFMIEADGRHWTTSEIYLSGDLWPKLDAVKAALAEGNSNPRMVAKLTYQERLLDEVIAPVPLEDVEIHLNSGFIPPEVLTAWLDARVVELRARNPGHPPGYYEASAQAVISYKDSFYHFSHDGKTIDDKLWGDLDLLFRHLNRTGVKKDELGALDTLDREFRDWLLTSPQRSTVETAYNRAFRGYRPRVYSEAPLAIPGLNPDRKLNAYHYAMLRWAMEAGKGIVAADVGLGKTTLALLLARLAVTMGRARKPVHFVPKSVLANWVREARSWFPDCRILTIGESVTTDRQGRDVVRTDNEAVRQRKYQELQQNDYDVVLVSDSAWNDLDLSPIVKGDYINDDFWVQRGDHLGQAGTKRMNKAREAYDQAMARRNFQDREETVHFDELGIDMILGDEFHRYKNLYQARSRWGQDPKFLGGSGLSNRAHDTSLKARFVRESRADGAGVFGFTATPTQNSPLEIYSILNHIAPEAFLRMGIRNAEEFLDRFCVFESDSILTLDGKIEQTLVTAGFKNLNELRPVMNRYILRKTAEDVGLKIPSPLAFEHLIDMSPDQEAAYADLRALANKEKDQDKEKIHVFSLIDRMGKASLDLALLDPEQHAHARSPKIETCAAQVLARIQEDGGGHLVFCEAVETHERIAEALVRAGLKHEQIGILNAQAVPTSTARLRLGDRFNAGQLKVLIGNTATMGEGLNLQEDTSDVHHLDLPWNDDILKQRNGRGRRQGNVREQVRIHLYLARRSFDGYRYQTIMGKRSWQDLLWHGGDTVENLARQTSLSRVDVMIMLADDPEAARTQYEADKAAAMERLALERRTQARTEFYRYQERRENLASLPSDTDPLVVARLRRTVAGLRDSLMANPDFLAKDALDSAEPCLYDPETGAIWRAGIAVQITEEVTERVCSTVRAGERFVTMGVNRREETVTLRPYAKASERHWTLAMGKLSAIGICSAFSPAEEQAEVAALLNAPLTVERRPIVLNPWDLRIFDQTFIEDYTGGLQRHLKSAISRYMDESSRTGYGFVTPEGEPVYVESYKGREEARKLDLILPTPAGRALMISGYNSIEKTKYVKVLYNNNKQYIAIVYKDFEYSKSVRGNPWTDLIETMFGRGALAEAKAIAHEQGMTTIASSKDFASAMRAAVTTIDSFKPFVWPQDTVLALAASAARFGVLHTPLQTAISFHGIDKQPIPAKFFTVNDREHHAQGTVLSFLSAVQPGLAQEWAALAPPPPSTQKQHEPAQQPMPMRMAM